MGKTIKAEHRILYAAGEGEVFGYFAWPTLAKTADGTLYAAASGFRCQHVDPMGKSVLFTSTDEGQSWSRPVIVNNSLIDDRDTGLCALPDNELLLSWFTQDTRKFWNDGPGRHFRPEVSRIDMDAVLADWDDDLVKQMTGSFLRRRNADGSWTRRVKVPVSAPHGPVRLYDGSLIYIGANFNRKNAANHSVIEVYKSSDKGGSWEFISDFTEPAGQYFCEPHLLETASGELLAFIRENTSFHTLQYRSNDGGYSWSEPQDLGYGAPPFAMRHSSGAIIVSVGWRQEPCGERVYVSYDNGETYQEFVLRDDGPMRDLGYPSTVELANGRLLTLYYQRQKPGDDFAALLLSEWELP